MTLALAARTIIVRTRCHRERFASPLVSWSARACGRYSVWRCRGCRCRCDSSLRGCCSPPGGRRSHRASRDRMASWQRAIVAGVPAVRSLRRSSTSRGRTARDRLLSVRHRRALRSRCRAVARDAGRRARGSSKGDLAACVAIVFGAASLGTSPSRIATRQTHRPRSYATTTPRTRVLRAEAAEASHTVPPMAAYYSGHALNAAVYPQLGSAASSLCRRACLCDVFRYAWPTFSPPARSRCSCWCDRCVTRRRALVRRVSAALAATSRILRRGSSHTPTELGLLLWPTNFCRPRCSCSSSRRDADDAGLVVRRCRDRHVVPYAPHGLVA